MALRLLQIGAIAVVLAATTHKAFELDRFLIPKEFVLHLTAALAGLFVLRRIPFRRIDLFLIAYLVVSALSAALSTNYWLGMRAFFVSASCIVIFWTARALREAGVEKGLLAGLAFAVVLAAATSLAQAYGVRLDLFSINRSPGGTLGNRNFVAHAAAFGLPICMFVTLHAKRWLGYVVGIIGIGAVTAALVLTRSRAAWLAAAAMLVVFLIGVLRDPALWPRFFGIVACAIGGVAAALLIPNTLRWRSDNPYLDSVTGVVNYEEGSGRGRLVQYERSLLMAARNPILGVGPGNWPVEYPDHAARNDPSMDDGNMTFNPWPSSDWIAFLSERGVVATLLLAVALLGIALKSKDPALWAVLAAAIVTGLFDAVLLLALPGFIVWAALGALGGSGGEAPAAVVPWPLTLLLILVSLAGTARSAAQIAAMEMYATGTNLELASRIDPGNYRIHMRLARDCDHALAARALFPHATAARRCREGSKLQFSVSPQTVESRLHRLWRN
jgi:O-antigen ligase